MSWPPDWPANALTAMRCAIWAGRRGRLEAFAREVGRRQWTEAADISDTDVLAASATTVGIEAAEMLEAIRQPELKEQLRSVTERAWEAGVKGVPTLRVGEALFFGDDRLEDAVGLLGARA